MTKLTLALLVSMAAGGVVGSAHADAVSPTSPEASKMIEKIKAAEAAIPTAADIAKETPNLCTTTSGFMVPCDQVEIVNMANDGYRAGFEDGSAGKEMNSNPAGAPGSYARGFAEGLSLRTGKLMGLQGDEEQAKTFQEALAKIPEEQRPAFKSKFRSLINYQDGVAAAAAAGGQ